MDNSFKITKDDDGIKLHKWMRKTFSGIPLSAIHKFLRTKKVKLNGKRAKGEEGLHEGDEVKIFFDPGKGVEKGASAISRRQISPKELAKWFPVVYEDEFLIAINKPPGIPVHPGSKVSLGKSIIEMAVQKYPSDNIRLVHRLDKDTSGVLLLAKNGGTLRKLLKQLRSDGFQKHYQALVFGHLIKKSGTIDLPLQRQEHGKKVIAGSGKKSVTHFEVRKELENTTLVDVLLETGRTHQIRAHFAAIGHPLVCDDQHGNFAKNKIFRKKYGLKRQFLHASSLSFQHPETAKRIQMVAPFPVDLKDVMDSLG